MPPSINYSQAIHDFHEARRKAELQKLFEPFTGETNKLLSYEEVRQKLKAIEGSQIVLTEIPLDAIVGSLGRYTDFTRDFLPRRDSDINRWATIMEKSLDLKGLPPIDVYRIGEAYFVIDGNHRVSVAKQLQASHIQAYVREVRSRVPLAADIQPDELIIKAEQASFLDATHVDMLRPQANLEVTIPGQYPILEEHIAVHRYFMGIEAQHEIPYDDAVVHWYDQVYLPAVKIIRENKILERFPNRTETDLYLWLSKHRGDLEESLGWKLGPEIVAKDLVYSYAKDFHQTIARLTERILDIVTPDPLESGPPVGHWRHKYVETREYQCLFENILVPLDKDLDQWHALDQALILAQREGSSLRGLHVLPTNGSEEESSIYLLQEAFTERCTQAGVSGELAVEEGGIARNICDRSHWADLVVSQLTHPPGDKPLARLGSGFRTMVRRCPRPILAVPCQVTHLDRVLLAYTGSPKAEEALYIAAYMAAKWGIHLTVLTIEHESQSALETQAPARAYLEALNVQAEYCLQAAGPRAEIIIRTAKENQSEVILIGGYKASPLVEVFLGSVVDQILRMAKIPVLICR